MNIWVVIGTSALASAIVNVVANIFIKHWEHQREDRKELERRNYIYLDIALQLEDFAAKASTLLERIENALARARSEADDRSLSDLDSIKFEFDPMPDWSKVPVDVASKAQGFPRSFARSQQFIFAAFEYWAGADDAWEYDAERIAFYGIQAIKFAAKLREGIQAPEDEYMQSSLETFERYIAKRRKYYEHTRTDGSVIPELFKMFQREDVQAGRLPPGAFVKSGSEPTD
jgi:hypothetical protein